MTLILDTHVFFWWVTGSDSLPARHRALLESSEETIYVSAVSGWEIAVKVKIGKWPDAAALEHHPTRRNRLRDSLVG